MNVIVVTPTNRVVYRPDTSRKRDEDDLYLPDYISKLSWSPVVYVRMARPGKCIAERFASRYYDAVAYGMLLYPENLIDDSPESYASAICIDRMSCLPGKTTPISDYKADSTTFTLTKDGEVLYSTSGINISELNRAIYLASSHCFLRTGDIVALELQSRAALCDIQDSSCSIRGLIEDVQADPFFIRGLANEESIKFNIYFQRP